MNEPPPAPPGGLYPPLDSSQPQGGIGFENVAGPQARKYLELVIDRGCLWM